MNDPISCPACDGTGGTSQPDFIGCTVCSGTGHIDRSRLVIGPQRRIWREPTAVEKLLSKLCIACTLIGFGVGLLIGVLF